MFHSANQLTAFYMMPTLVCVLDYGWKYIQPSVEKSPISVTYFSVSRIRLKNKNIDTTLEKKNIRCN